MKVVKGCAGSTRVAVNKGVGGKVWLHQRTFTPTIQAVLAEWYLNARTIIVWSAGSRRLRRRPDRLTRRLLRHFVTISIVADFDADLID